MMVRHQTDLKGYTLVELVAAITIIMILMAFGAMSFGSIVSDGKFRDDVVRVQGVIQKTTSDCLTRGLRGRVVVGPLESESDSTITDRTIRGFYMSDDGTLTESFRTVCEDSEFSRTEPAPSPWLKSEAVGVATTFENDTINIMPSGLVEQSGVVFLNFRGHEVVLEVLANGMVETFFYDGLDSNGEEIWTR